MPEGLLGEFPCGLVRCTCDVCDTPSRSPPNILQCIIVIATFYFKQVVQTRTPCVLVSIRKKLENLSSWLSSYVASYLYMLCMPIPQLVLSLFHSQQQALNFALASPVMSISAHFGL